MRRQVLIAGAVMLAPLLTVPAVAKSETGGAGKARPAAALPRPKVEAAPGLGRLVLPPAGKAGYSIVTTEERVVITHKQGGRVPDVARLPRNVTAMRSDATTTELRLAPGVRVRSRVVGAGLVVEVLDAPPAVRVGGVSKLLPMADVPVPEPDPVVAAAPAAAPEPVADTAGGEKAGGEKAGGEKVGGEKVGIAQSGLARDVPVPAASGPQDGLATAAVGIERIGEGERPAILLRAAREVGAAAFRSGGDLVVVLDVPIAFKVPDAGLGDRFATVTVRRTQDATVVRVANAGPMRLERTSRGWVVAAGAPVEGVGIEPRLVEPDTEHSSVRFVAEQPSRVVTVLDDGGATLLVGTQGVAGQAVVAERKQTQFTLRPTVQGVVVVARSDDLRLQRETDGFSLSGGPHTGGTVLLPGERAVAESQPFDTHSRLFTIPSESVPALSRRLGEQKQAAVAAPALARSEPRIRAAETMMGLGLGVEAQAALDVAVADDPAVGETPRVIGLRGAAAMLAQRPTQAQLLMDPRVSGSTEIELWRGMLKATQNKLRPGDVKRLARGLPLLLAYPAPLRDRLLPGVLETLALNGDVETAKAALQTLPPEPALDLVRGMVLEASGAVEPALATYDRVAASLDRLPRYRALVRGIELRLKSGELDASKAADRLDRAVYGWRGSPQEIELRIRIAQLRQQAGQWREALTMLRDGRTAFPEEREPFDREMAAALQALFADAAKGGAAGRMAPAELVAIFDENAEAIRAITWTEQNGMALVERLTSLGLSARAEPVLSAILGNTQDPLRRAVVGARLAALRLGAGNATGAVQALSETTPTTAAGMDAGVMTARQTLFARAEAARGNQDTALRMLRTIGTAEADEARADIYSAKGDWPRAVAALQELEAKRLPKDAAGGAAAELNTEQQGIAMRLAVASALAGDTTTLQRVATSYGAAMSKTPSGATFQLMTSPPVRAMGDLPRAFDEIKLVQQMKGQVVGAGNAGAGK